MVGDFGGASFRAWTKSPMKILSEASFSLTSGRRDAYARPSIELCCDAGVERRALNISARSSMLVVTGWTRSPFPGVGVGGTTFNPGVSQRFRIGHEERLTWIFAKITAAKFLTSCECIRC